MNVVESKTESEPTGVLIDTWWNVNRQELKRMLTLRTCFNRYMVECEYRELVYLVSNQTVLIDTWWNVNTAFDVDKVVKQLGFNRYMVECELSINNCTLFFAITF